MIWRLAAFLAAIIVAGCSSPSSDIAAASPRYIEPTPKLPEHVAYVGGLSELESLTATLMLLEPFDRLRCVALTSPPYKASPTDWGKDIQFPSVDLINYLNKHSNSKHVSISTCFPRYGNNWHISTGDIAVYIWVEQVKCKQQEDNRLDVYCLEFGWQKQSHFASGYLVRAEREGNRFLLKNLSSWVT